MSKFVGKTLKSLNSILNNSTLLSSDTEKTSTKFISWYLDSESFVRKLKYADSKQTEDDIIKTYLSAIQNRLSEPNVPSSEVQEMIKMCMISESMGYSSPFIYVHCLKLAQKGNLQEKHTGYLASTYFMNSQDELVILLINTIQKDLSSSNYMEVLCALSATCHLINSENVPNVLSLVEDRLSHEKSAVRKAALLTLGHCLHLSSSISQYQMSFTKIEKCLSDRDLDVVSAAVSLLSKIVQVISGDFSYLISSLLQLQEQILLRRVPKSIIYNDIPAPWLQLDILRFFKIICKTSSHVEMVTPVLKKTLEQIGIQTTISHAIIYQTIDTIISIGPRNELIELAISSISLFLKSKHVNLKLTGIEALILVVQKLKINVSVTHQEVVMECLKFPDTTLQLKALDLLFYLANPSNVQAICKKFLEFLSNCSHEDKKKNLAVKILQLSKKFIHKKEWFVSTMLSVLVQIGSSLPSSEIHDLINIILQDKSLQEMTKKSCLELIKAQFIPSSILKITASVLETSSEFEEILPIFIPKISEIEASWLLVSLTYVVLKTKQIPETLVIYLQNLKMEEESVLELLDQLLQIVKDLQNFKEFVPDEQIDPSLTFLDDYVINSLENGGSCYQPHSFRNTDFTVKESVALSDIDSFTDIVSSAKDPVESSSCVSPSYSVFSSPSTSFQSLPHEKDTTTYPVYKPKNIWTEEGRKNMDEPINDSILVKENEDLQQITACDDELKDLFAGLS